MNLCDYCESRLTRMTTATSCCDNCGCKFYVDSSDEHPIHRTTGPTRPDAPSSSEIRIELSSTEQPSTELPIEQPSAELPFTEAKRRFERDYLSRLMAISEGSVTGAARLAGVDRTNFRRLLQRSGLRPRATTPTTTTTTTTTNTAHAATYTDRSAYFSGTACEVHVPGCGPTPR